jgi:hypothetical protein
MDCDLQITWEQEDAPPRGRYFFSSSGGSGLVRLLLDETRHELRVNQVTRSHHLLIGLIGWLPRLEGAFGFQSGPPGEALPEEISRAAINSGWAFRPVLWWFQATHPGFRLLTRLTPPPLRRVPARWFWGVLYPLVYVLAMVYLLAAAGPLDREGWLLLLGISAVWWGVWGFLTWMLLGFPRFWKSGQR